MEEQIDFDDQEVEEVVEESEEEKKKREQERIEREEREKREFLSIEDLQNRAKLSQTLIDKLRDMHILDGLPESSQLSLF